jgi:hypothetical protein
MKARPSFRLPAYHLFRRFAGPIFSYRLARIGI